MDKSTYIPTLDGWRAIAILLVIVGHATLPPAHGAWILHNPGLGVDIFFGLSGFLICSRLLIEWRDTGTISRSEFYLRRAFRILPAYWFALGTLALAAWAKLIPATPAELWSSFFFLRNYLPIDQGGWYSGHFWSLAVEEHFYLMMPALLVVLGPARRALYTFIGLAGAIGIWRFVDFHLARGTSRLNFFTRTDIRLDAILLGSVVALLLFQRPALRQVFRRRPLLPYCLLAGLSAILIIQPPFQMTWTAVLIPVLLSSTACCPESGLSKLLEHPWLRFIGRLSYSLYLWQQFFLIGEASNGVRPAALPVWQQLPLNLVPTFAMALISFYLIEQPMLSLGRRLLKARKTNAALPGRNTTAAAASAGGMAS